MVMWMNGFTAQKVYEWMDEWMDGGNEGSHGNK
jgi:hypothetical protein